MNIGLTEALQRSASFYHPIIHFDKTRDHFLQLDFTDKNDELKTIDYINTDTFSAYINKKLKDNNCKFGIGGYKEKRIIYNRSKLFNENDEPRNIHLGIDIWGAVGTAVMAPLGGMVHGFDFNNDFGDYGATIILQHQLDTTNFYTLYGHLSIGDIASLRIGSVITRGETFAHFGTPGENGNWPPHLHFQIIEDIGQYEGNYPGVCSIHEAQNFFNNSPDPDLVLNMVKYAKG